MGAVHGIEGFRGLAKVRPTKFKGLPQHTLSSAPQGNGGTTTNMQTGTKSCTSGRTRSARQDPGILKNNLGFLQNGVSSINISTDLQRLVILDFQILSRVTK